MKSQHYPPWDIRWRQPDMQTLLTCSKLAYSGLSRAWECGLVGSKPPPAPWGWELTAPLWRTSGVEWPEELSESREGTATISLPASPSCHMQHSNMTQPKTYRQYIVTRHQLSGNRLHGSRHLYACEFTASKSKCVFSDKCRRRMKGEPNEEAKGKKTWSYSGNATHTRDNRIKNVHGESNCDCHIQRNGLKYW